MPPKMLNTVPKFLTAPAESEPEPESVPPEESPQLSHGFDTGLGAAAATSPIFIQGAVRRFGVLFKNEDDAYSPMLLTPYRHFHRDRHYRERQRIFLPQKYLPVIVPLRHQRDLRFTAL